MPSLAYVSQIGPCHDLDNHKQPHLCNTTVSYYDNACRNSGLFSTAYRCAVICNDNWSHLFSRFGGKRLHLSNVDYVACNMTAALHCSTRAERKFMHHRRWPAETGLTGRRQVQLLYLAISLTRHQHASRHVAVVTAKLLSERTDTQTHLFDCFAWTTKAVGRVNLMSTNCKR